MSLKTTPVSLLLTRKNPEVHSIPVTATVREAVAEMNRHRIGCVLVKDGSEVVGIFTERDVLTRVVSEARDPRTTPVADVMTPNPNRISTETTVGDAMKQMTEKRTRHLPVFDSSGQLAGLVSIGDVTRWQSEENQAEADHLKNYVFGEFPA